MAYCLDEYVDVFGTIVDAEVDEVRKGKKESDASHNRKRNAKLQEILSRGSAPKVEKKVFAPIVEPKRWKGGKSG